ncbi:MAG: SCO1664 family protein [Mycobacterium sp.]
MNLKPDDREALRLGQLTILGRIRSASNATFLCEATLAGQPVHCVYKPVAGEQPLWDFPTGTLAGRELSAYLISVELGWNMVPYTIIRDGPAGPGMLQLWIHQPGDAVSGPDSAPRGGCDLVELVPEGKVPPGYLAVLQARNYAGEAVTLVHADDARLRRVAVLDVLINNADRKGGHILSGIDGGVYGIDHGVCLHSDDKLRTVLWGWADRPVGDETLAAVAGLVDALAGPLAEALKPHLTAGEIAALRRRAGDLIDNPVLPSPSVHRPIPWPAF